jgi:hypothetical protein
VSSLRSESEKLKLQLEAIQTRLKALK